MNWSGENTELTKNGDDTRLFTAVKKRDNIEKPRDNEWLGKEMADEIQLRWMHMGKYNLYT